MSNTEARHAYLESIREVIHAEAVERAARYNLPLHEAVSQVAEGYAEGWEEEQAMLRADGNAAAWEE